MKKINKYTAVILCLTLLLPLLSGTSGVFTIASAAETFTAGIYTYTVTDGNATITEIQPYDSATELIIPSTLGGYPVTVIDDYAVETLTSNVKDITVSEGITKIGKSAFERLRYAEAIHLPASLTEFSGAAIGTTVWKNITVAENSAILTVEDGALFSKDKTILYKYISSDTSEKVYYIPETVKELADYAFYKVDHLESIILPEGIESLGQLALNQCTSLKSVHIPKSVKHIDPLALSIKGPDITAFSVDDDNEYYTEIDGILYTKDKTTLIMTPSGKILGDFVVPSFVQEVLYNAFSSSNQLTSVTYHENITEINLTYALTVRNIDIYILNPEAVLETILPTLRMSTITLHGYKNSAVEAFAEEHDAIFVAIDDEILPEEPSTEEPTTEEPTTEEPTTEEPTTEEPTTEEPTTEEPAPSFNSSYKQGDIIEFGMYPQTLVTDEELTEELSWYIEEAEWQSLGWFRGTGKAGTMYETDTGMFCDIDYYGEKYRAVTFSEHRAYETFSNPTSSYQAPLGYTPGNIYYFKYEPVKWRVLDPANGLLLAVDILDAPAYSNYAYPGTPEDGDTSTLDYYYSDAALTKYTSNWEYSTLRTFLNTTFTDTAFTDLQKSLIGKTELDNSVVNGGNAKFSGNNTEDNVFILSTKEIGYDSYYGLSNTLRTKNGTDYAHMHGLFAGTKNQGEAALYYLRDPATSGTVAFVSEKGVISSSTNAYSQDIGVVPAICMNLEEFEKLDLYKNIIIDFNDGVLTVSGIGSLPDPEKSVTDILSPYKEITTAVIIEDGITEISENAFAGFIELKSLILNGTTALDNKCFPDSFQLSTIIMKDETEFRGNPFCDYISYINIFVKYGVSYSYEYFPEEVNSYTYQYNGTAIETNGNITMNTYEFFDFMAVMCDDYDVIETIKFNKFTSTDLRFYSVDSKTGEKTLIPDSTLHNVTFSVQVNTDGDIKPVTFNELCEMASEGRLEEFYLISNSLTDGEIEDTEMEIKSIGDIFEYALKWIVSLLNRFFALFTRK